MKDVYASPTPKLSGVFGGHLNFGDPRRYWDFRSLGHGSVNFEEWARAKVWTDAKGCIADLKKSATGTLDHPVISEAGRKFLADLLVQLSDQQLHDLFDVARFPLRSGHPVDEWVEAFKHKRDDIVTRTCPS